MKIIEKDYAATINFGELEVGATFKFDSNVWMKTESVSNIQTKINAILLTTGTFDKFFKDTEKVGVITGSFVEE